MKPRRACLLLVLATIVANVTIALFVGVGRHPRPSIVRSFPVTDAYAPLFRIVVDGKSGYIDDRGDIVIAPQFENGADYFSEGRAWVAVGDLYGYIDAKGKLVTDLAFRQAADFHEGLAAVCPLGSSRFGYVDRNGSIIIPAQFDAAEPFYGGMARIGMQTTSNKVVRSVADVGAEFEWSLIDRDGLIVTMEDTEEPRPSTYGSVTELVDQGRFRAIQEFSSGLAGAQTADGWVVINTFGDIVANGPYQEVGKAHSGLVPVKGGGKWGFVSARGQVVVVHQFDWVYGYRDGLWSVGVKGGIGYLSSCGSLVWPKNDTNGD